MLQVHCRASKEVSASDSAVRDPVLPGEPSQKSDAAPSEFPPNVASATGTAAATIRKFYSAFNRGDFDALTELFSEDCVYHDAVYLEPKFGRASITAYFKQFKVGVDLDCLHFTVTELAGNETSCGVAWCGHTPCFVGHGFVPVLLLLQPAP